MSDRRAYGGKTLNDGISKKNECVKETGEAIGPWQIQGPESKEESKGRNDHPDWLFS
jgi:hypothetical protein